MLKGAKSSQKADVRPISFLLEDDLPGGDGLTYFRFGIRPEDLTRIEPSRMAVQQTLGGAWLDNFGPGVRTIQIAGHTGWRGDDEVWGGDDGMTVFENLNSLVFRQWHRRRAEAVEKGLDPDKIRLVFADKLDNICSVVAPMSFTLRRNRQRPLLMQYQISLTVLDNDVESEFGDVKLEAPDAKSTFATGKSGLEDLADRICNGANDVQKWIDGNLGKQAKDLMNMTGDVLKQVTRISNASDGVMSSLVGVARDLTKAGTNVFRSIATLASIPSRAVSRISEIASMFWGAYCLIKKMFKGMFAPNYAGFYGASNCSSTAGGKPMSPLRNVNALYALAGGVGAAAVMSNVLGSVGGGVSAVTKAVGAAGALGDAASGVVGAIPGLASKVETAAAGLTDKAQAALADLADRLDPVANKIAGRAEAAVAELGPKLEDIAKGITITLPPPPAIKVSTFVGELSFSA